MRPFRSRSRVRPATTDGSTTPPETHSARVVRTTTRAPSTNATTRTPTSGRSSHHAPHPVTDGSGDIWCDELHFVGGWNTNRAFYNEGCDHYVGPVKKLHAIYSYPANA